MKAYFDISSMLEEFYQKAPFMTFENLVETRKIIQDFLHNYVDNNSKIFRQGVEVMMKIYDIMSQKYPLEKEAIDNSNN